ncbi:uncharacterized protein ARMOST_21873 [Armillaria ostoyae]|uniref:Uncharacterized protein n=1 Tax=Armillaria ostoyae TaxID=47428 RepID=A0A284SBA0_ARMOS|nr:uncharacterized protein ARMOST_21873 [Armillaria ostoyae]
MKEHRKHSGVYTSLIGVGRPSTRNIPYSNICGLSLPTGASPGSLSRLTTSSPCLSFSSDYKNLVVSERTLVALAEPPAQFSFAPTLDFMDITLYIDDIIVSDFTDYSTITLSRLQRV